MVKMATNQNGDMATKSKPKQSWNQNGDKCILFNLRLKRHEHTSLTSVPLISVQWCIRQKLDDGRHHSVKI